MRSRNNVNFARKKNLMQLGSIIQINRWTTDGNWQLNVIRCQIKCRSCNFYSPNKNICLRYWCFQNSNLAMMFWKSLLWTVIFKFLHTHKNIQNLLSISTKEKLLTPQNKKPKKLFNDENSHYLLLFCFLMCCSICYQQHGSRMGVSTRNLWWNLKSWKINLKLKGICLKENSFNSFTIQCTESICEFEITIVIFSASPSLFLY